jgi:hypothetical protein
MFGICLHQLPETAERDDERSEWEEHIFHRSYSHGTEAPLKHRFALLCTLVAYNSTRRNKEV